MKRQMTNLDVAVWVVLVGTFLICMMILYGVLPAEPFDKERYLSLQKKIFQECVVEQTNTSYQNSIYHIAENCMSLALDKSRKIMENERRMIKTKNGE